MSAAEEASLAATSKKSVVTQGGGRERLPSQKFSLTGDSSLSTCNGERMPVIMQRLSSHMNSNACGSRRSSERKKTLSLQSRRATAIEQPFKNFEAEARRPRLTVQEEVMQQNRVALLNYARWGAVRFKSRQQELEYQEYTRRHDAPRWIQFLHRFFCVFVVGFVIFLIYSGTNSGFHGPVDYYLVRHFEWPSCLLLLVVMATLILPFARVSAAHRVQPLVHAWFTLTVLAIGAFDIFPKLTAERFSRTEDGGLWAEANAAYESGEPRASNATRMLEAYLTQQLHQWDWVLMFNCTFFLGAVLHLFQPSYNWTCVMAAETLAVFVVAIAVHPSHAPDSRVDYDELGHVNWVLYRLLTLLAVLLLFLVGSREHECTRRDIFILMTIMAKHNAALNADNEKLKAEVEKNRQQDAAEGEVDLDAPMQKVMASLREMQADPLLLHWKADLQRSIEALSNNASTMWLPRTLPHSAMDNDSTLQQVQCYLGTAGNSYSVSQRFHRDISAPSPPQGTCPSIHGPIPSSVGLRLVGRESGAGSAAPTPRGARGDWDATGAQRSSQHPQRSSQRSSQSRASSHGGARPRPRLHQSLPPGLLSASLAGLSSDRLRGAPPDEPPAPEGAAGPDGTPAAPSIELDPVGRSGRVASLSRGTPACEAAGAVAADEGPHGAGSKPAPLGLGARLSGLKPSTPGHASTHALSIIVERDSARGSARTQGAPASTSAQLAALFSGPAGPGGSQRSLRGSELLLGAGEVAAAKRRAGRCSAPELEVRREARAPVVGAPPSPPAGAATAAAAEAAAAEAAAAEAAVAEAAAAEESAESEAGRRVADESEASLRSAERDPSCDSASGGVPALQRETVAARAARPAGLSAVPGSQELVDLDEYEPADGSEVGTLDAGPRWVYAGRPRLLRPGCAALTEARARELVAAAMDCWDGHPAASAHWQGDPLHPSDPPDETGRYGGPGHTVDGRGALGVFALREACGEAQLGLMLRHAFEALRLHEALPLRMEAAPLFALELSHHYWAVPYHNCMHACDVLQSTYWILQALTPEQRLPPLAAAGLLVAAVIHDVGHPGSNNALQVSMLSPLALKYNDQHVLEMMHASLGMQLLSIAELNIFADLSPAQYRQMRALIIEAVLATDMASHFEMVNKMKLKLKGGPLDFGPDPAADGEHQPTPEQHENLGLFMKNALHAADIGSVGKPWPLYFAWAQRVFAEFFAQGDREREMGLKVAPFMDREVASIPKAQQGFITYICLPLLESLVELYPQLRVISRNMHDNIKLLHAMENMSTDEIMKLAIPTSLSAPFSSGRPRDEGSVSTIRF